jgi:hypothetical protein
MAVAATPTVKRRDWRLIIWRIVAGLFALFFLLIGGVVLLDPWIQLVPAVTESQNPDAWRWYAAVWAAVTVILGAGPLLMLLRRPRERPLLMQFWVLGQVATTAAWLTATWPAFEFDEIIMILIVLVAYPAPRALLSLRSEERISKPLLGLSLLAAVALAPVLWSNLQLQLTDAGSEFHTTGQYMHVVYITLLVPLGGLLAATRRPGWQMLAAIIGIALIYLGAASITVPTHPGSWGMLGGLASLLGGLAFVALPRYEDRRERHESSAQ